MGKPIRPRPMKPISRLVMVAPPRARVLGRRGAPKWPPIPRRWAAAAEPRRGMLPAPSGSGHPALLVLLLGGALDAAFLDLAAPGARLAAPALDEVLEALQVALHAHLHDAEGVAEVF